VPGNLALYRKYRSATFAEVIGQDHITVPLSQAVRSGRVNHAYLFSGPRGCGKTSSARILARSLNCAEGPTATPCGVCDSCRELAPNGPGSIDVIEIDAASHGGVDDARDLRERAFYAPVRDRYKVYIIDEAHMVTTQGFNALLKLIEEPPDFLIFVFATTEPDKVLPTIRSRTHHYPFRLVPPGVLRGHLERICAAEEVAVEPAVLPLVIRAGGGSVRDSLSILDQLLAGAGDDGITYATAVALLGVTDSALLDDMVDALAAADAVAVYGTIDRLVEAGHDPRRFAADLLDRFRDLIVLEAVPDAGDRGLIDGPVDALDRMADQARRLGSATLTRYAEIVHTALIEMRGTTSPRLVLELLCARMQLPDAAADSAAILQRLERLERRQSLTQSQAGAESQQPQPAATASPQKDTSEQPRPEQQPTAEQPRPLQQPPAEQQAPPGPRTQPAPLPAPVPDAPSERPAGGDADLSTSSGSGIDAAAIRRLWPEILDVVKRSSRRTRALLDNAQVAGLEGNRVRLRAGAPLARMIGEPSNTMLLTQALTSVLGGGWQVDVEVDDGEPALTLPEKTATIAAVAVADERDELLDDRAAPRPDPEAEALALLRTTFGARPLDEAG
jgi:DNA polymerase III subunit gamma/tau